MPNIPLNENAIYATPKKINRIVFCVLCFCKSLVISCYAFVFGRQISMNSNFWEYIAEVITCGTPGVKPKSEQEVKETNGD
jgi:hypothetical protein